MKFGLMQLIGEGLSKIWPQDIPGEPARIEETSKGIRKSQRVGLPDVVIFKYCIFGTFVFSHTVVGINPFYLRNNSNST